MMGILWFFRLILRWNENLFFLIMIMFGGFVFVILNSLFKGVKLNL